VTEISGRIKASLSLLLCFVVSLFEGMDNVSMGLAAPKLGPEFHLSPAQIGLALSASLFGLMIGALVGGRLADRWGRKRVLIASISALGLFSLGTLLGREFGVLVLMRLLVGLGLGGAFPILIAIAAETSSPRLRATGISMVYCGQPLGAAIISLIIGLGGAGMDWRAVFYVGGLGPLVLVPVLACFLSEPDGFRAARIVTGANPDSKSVVKILFGRGKALTTLLLWASSIFTLFVVYLLLSWIPSLMVSKGLTRPQGAIISMTLNFGAAAGVLVFGAATDRGYRRQTIVAAYMALVLSLAGLVYFNGFPAMLAFGGLAGFFMLGSQLILYALAADCYPTLVRGTGVGAAVAFGRAGSAIAPLVGGAVLSAGYGAAAVLATAIPCVFVAAGAAVALLVHLGRMDQERIAAA
jgi:AAHS family 3-hydroxyphenylpropionic acid transporter